MRNQKLVDYYEATQEAFIGSKKDNLTVKEINEETARFTEAVRCAVNDKDFDIDAFRDADKFKAMIDIRLKQIKAVSEEIEIRPWMLSTYVPVGRAI